MSDLREALGRAWNTLPSALRAHPGIKGLYAIAEAALSAEPAQPNTPHDAGSHNQRMTPALQRVIDAADKRERDRTAMPPACPTPTGCRENGCHGECIPAEPVQEMTDERICDLMGWNVEAMQRNEPDNLTTRVRALVRVAEAEAVAADRASRLSEITDEQIHRLWASNAAGGYLDFARAVEALVRGKT